MKRASQLASALPGKMRITDVCNRLTTRAPCEPFDSRLRLRRPRGFLRAPTRGRSLGLHLGGASLDGDPPASALDAHRFTSQMHGLPRAWCKNEIPLGPGGCRDRRPLRRCPPATVFSTMSRAGDVASDAPVAPDDLRPAFAETTFAGRQTRFHRRLVKDGCFHRPERLPSTSAPSARSRRLHGEPATVLTTLPSRSGFRRPFASPTGKTLGETRPVTVR